MTQPAALAIVADAIDQQLDEDERQFGLFGAPATEAGVAKMAKAMLGQRGPGRPAGARNKRTEATVAHLLARYRDPRAVALERIQMHPADLAAATGCTLFEAIQEQRLLIGVVLPFIAARITPEVVDNRQIMHLHFNTGAPGVAATGAIRVLDPGEYSEVADTSSASTDDGSEG